MLGAAAGDEFKGEEFGRDALKERADAGAGEGLVAVDGEGVLIHLRAAGGVIGAQRRRAAPDLLAVGAGERLVQVHAADMAAEGAVRVEHAVDVAKRLLLGAQGGIGVHQVPGIEHEALVLIGDEVEQQARHGGRGEGEAGLPEVLHQQGDGAVLAVEELVEQRGACADDVLVAVAVAERKGFLRGGVGDMEHDVLRAVAAGVGKVAAEGAKQRGAVGAAKAGGHVLLRAELGEQARPVALPEREPAGEIPHVQAHHVLRLHGKGRGRIVDAHQLQPVEAVERRAKARVRAKAQQVLRAGGQVEHELCAAGRGFLQSAGGPHQNSIPLLAGTPRA